MIARGKYNEFKKVVKYIAKVNNRKLDPEFNEFEKIATLYDTDFSIEKDEL